MKKRFISFGTISIISILTIVVVVFGQNNNNFRKNSPLVERIGQAIKNKEKKFTQHEITKTERLNNNMLSSAVVWRFGEFGVQTYFLEFDTVQEAIDHLYNDYINDIKSASYYGRSSYQS